MYVIWKYSTSLRKDSVSHKYNHIWDIMIRQSWNEWEIEDVAKMIRLLIKSWVILWSLPFIELSYIYDVILIVYHLIDRIYVRCSISERNSHYREFDLNIFCSYDIDDYMISLFSIIFFYIYHNIFKNFGNYVTKFEWYFEDRRILILKK